jgi:tetratricopeptide (TPR) repeat protein
MGGVVWHLVAGLIAILAAPSTSTANPQSETLRARAADELYSLEGERALASYREAVAADPDDSAAHRGLAGALWLSETFRRGTMTVDSYLGGVSRSNVKLPPPPAELLREFEAVTARAIAMARKKIAANPRDPDAHYELGAAVGLRASFAATIQGSVRAAFGSAREAYAAHERVMELDARRRDAGLVVGTYRYLIAGMALPVRWVAYAAGFGGGREKGISMVREAADYGGENRIDARVALVLLYNRERRYDAALEQLDKLRAEYPRNRLFWLETGGTLLRAGRHAEANRMLSEGIDRLAGDRRTRMAGEEAMWYQKRGAARTALGLVAEARADLHRSLESEGRRWVHGRARLDLGRLALQSNDRARAQEEWKTAVSLCESDNDQPCANDARRLLDTARNSR